MPQSSNEPLDNEARQRVRDQLALMKTANNENLAWDTPDAADFNFLFYPGRVLVSDTQREAFEALVSSRDELDGTRREVEREQDGGLLPGLGSYELPARTGDRGQDVLEALRIFDNTLGRGKVMPDHYVHLATSGNGRACPATEPEETGLREAWPEKTTHLDAGKGVRVVVVDTGWVPANPGSPMRTLQAYDGHGSFAEAVVRCRAPGARITHREFPIQGGAILESDLATQLDSALSAARPPHVINLSAGCHTRNNRRPKAFQVLWRTKLKAMKNTVLVAAAGNDSSPAPFYPAASLWAVGVGSLDHGGGVSSFSNYDRSADVFVLGRNHINRFPRGRYVCNESPNTGDQRVFSSGWARWSGTSFAAPLLTGLIAVHIQRTGLPAREAAKDLIRTRGHWRHEPLYGDYRLIDQPPY